MALPELVDVMYENQEYSPKLQYMTGVARDDASYLICEHISCCNFKHESWSTKWSFVVIILMLLMVIHCVERHHLRVQYPTC